MEVANRASVRASKRASFVLMMIVLSSLQFATVLLIVLGLSFVNWGQRSPNEGDVTEMIAAGVLYSASLYFTIPRLCRREIRRELFHHGVSICPECEYDLRGINPPRCPECGTSLDRPSEQTVQKP